MSAQTAGHPSLWPPRVSPHFGDYSIRDLAAKFLIQLDDFAEIERYRQANASETSRDDGRPTVVLMGDSITDFWPQEALSRSRGVRLINRGVAGQNSSVMLLRFQADVIELAPSAVVILAGSNDLRAYVGDPDAITVGAVERLARNLSAMADMAAGRGISIALATLPPVSGDLVSVARSPAAIRTANARITRIAVDRGYPLVDYHAALAGPDGLMPVDRSDDGIHPNACGYARMTPALFDAIEALAVSTQDLSP
ncbi:MAG: capsular biosynthesis protein [Alphaproteobacteria bacterium]|nr:capsular biosynthesis protein [Alphaproteobacteria bacterium]MBU2379358.1 capsular biosynthesis protein [Alphaproteobacteria bacterium]